MTSEDLPRRKKIRLAGYDYSRNGLYFVTVCVKDKQEVLWENVGANSVRPLSDTHKIRPKLSDVGKVVRGKINEIEEVYSSVTVEMFCIMPDHIHMILQIRSQRTNGRTMFAPTGDVPTLSRVIKHFKEAVTKSLAYPIWQKSFYDTIIKNEKQHLEMRQYIAQNPAKYLDKMLNEQE